MRLRHKLAGRALLWRAKWALTAGIALAIGCSDSSRPPGGSGSAQGSSGEGGAGGAGAMSGGGEGGAGAQGGAGGQGGGGSVCGNGVVEAGEACDGDCPAACPDDGDACTSEALAGSAATCDAVCEAQPVTACAEGDGCCPAGCGIADDIDCGGCDVIVPDGAPTISAGLLASPQPGTVCVRPGVYTEDLTLRPHVSLRGFGPSTEIVGVVSVIGMPDADPTPTVVRDLTIESTSLAAVTTCPVEDSFCNAGLALGGLTLALSMEGVLIKSEGAQGTVYCSKLEASDGALLYALRDSICRSDRGARFVGTFLSDVPSRFELDVERSRFEAEAGVTGILNGIEFHAAAPGPCGQKMVPAGSVARARIVNNEFFHTENQGVYLSPCLVMDAADAMKSSVVVANNTFVPYKNATGNQAFAIWNNGPAAFEPSLTVANNLYVGNNAALVRETAPDVIESNLLMVASPFVNLNGGDLHLAAGSSAIDAASAAHAPADDKDGKPRPADGDMDGQSLPDVGAHELSP
jgi:hypothetical protein